MKTKETGNVSDGVIKQMEEFAAKLLIDEIFVYNKRKEAGVIFDIHVYNN